MGCANSLPVIVVIGLSLCLVAGMFIGAGLGALARIHRAEMDKQYGEWLRRFYDEPRTMRVMP